MVFSLSITCEVNRQNNIGLKDFYIAGTMYGSGLQYFNFACLFLSYYYKTGKKHYERPDGSHYSLVLKAMQNIYTIELLQLHCLSIFCTVDMKQETQSQGT